MRLLSYGQHGAGTFRYTSETKKFLGLDCSILDQEVTGSKPTIACVSIVNNFAVKVRQPLEESSNVTKCACTVNIPIWLNRVYTEDVDLLITTQEGTTPFNPSGEDIRPSVDGEDYTTTSGVVTILAGDQYGYFNVDLLDNPSNNEKSYFKVNLVDVVSNNLCTSSLNTKIVIQPTG